jgi:hypothetical protein
MKAAAWGNNEPEDRLTVVLKVTEDCSAAGEQLKQTGEPNVTKLAL